MTYKLKYLGGIIAFAILIFMSTGGGYGGDLITLKNKGNLNGAYFIPETGSDYISAGLIFNFGEFDLQGPEGLAHYLEHLGARVVDKITGKDKTIRGHSNNASTNGFNTQYYASGPANQLPEILKGFSGLFKPITLEHDAMVKELDIVRREYDYRALNNIDLKIQSLIDRSFFGAGNGTGRSVIGTPESIAQLTPAKALALHKSTYHPTNVSLLISGNLPVTEVEKYVKKYFSDIPAGQKMIKKWPQALGAKTFRKQISIYEKQLAKPRIYYQKLFPEPITMDYHKLSFAVYYVNEIINSSFTGSLKRALTIDEFIASPYRFSVNFYSHDKVLTIMFRAKPDRDVSLTRLLAVFEDKLADMLASEIFAKNFARVKQRAVRDFKQAEEDPYRKTMSVIAYNHSLIANGIKPIPFAAIADAAKSVTIDDINKLVKMLGAKGRIVIVKAFPTN